MAWIPAAIGGAMHISGTFLEGRAGDIKRQRLLDVADTPGVDIGSATSESLANTEKYLPQAERIASETSRANQANLLAEEEAALPGAAAARQRNLSAINSLFSDDAEWLQGLQRRGAAMGVGQGLFGSGAQQVGTLRMSDREKMARTQLGTGLLGSLLSSLRLANTPGVQTFMGPSPTQTVAIRSNERNQRMNLQAAAAGVPGMTAAFSNSLKEVGGMLMGAGMMGMMGGGGGAGAGAAAAGSYAGGGMALNSAGGSWNTPYYNWEDQATARQYGILR